MKPAPFLPLLAALGVFSSISVASAAWVRLPNQAIKPINLAADGIANTGIASSSGINKPANLINEDPTLPAQISAGRSHAVIRLNSQQNIEQVSISNGGAAGVLNIQGSTDNKTWTALSQVSFAASEAAVTARFSPIQVRYVRLDFEAASAGSINHVNIIGAAESAPASSASTSSAKSQTNLACAVGGARPVYINPTPVNVGSTEFDVNIFRFPKSNQAANTIIYDLGEPQIVSDVSLAYDLRPSRIDVFAFDQLPEKKDWRGKLTLDPSFLDSATPVAVGVDSKGIGRIKIQPDSPINTKYVIIRQQPLTQNSGIGSVINGIAAQFGFESAQPVAAPSAGSTISSVFINAAFSPSAYNNAIASALGNTPSENGSGDGSGDSSGDSNTASFDKADQTMLIPPAFLGQYDYRINGGIGGGSNSGSGSESSPPPTVVNNIVRPIVRPVPVPPDQSTVGP